MNNFEKIKNLSDGKIEFNKDYLQWGKELKINLEKINLDGSREFENDTFKIVPYDWDGLQDCNCNYDRDLEKLYDNNVTDEEFIKYEQNHMHNINCNFRRTNFYHKPTGIAIEWRKNINRFKYINKKISYEDWQVIVQDCVKSVLTDKYIKPVKEIKLNCIINFKNHKETGEEFLEKFNKFIVGNGWEIINN